MFSLQFSHFHILLMTIFKLKGVLAAVKFYPVETIISD